MRQPFQVLIYPVISVGGSWEYLLLRRISSRGGFWQGVTGGVEKDEDLKEAAVRELFEETGFIPSSLKQIDYSHSFPMQEEWRNIYATDVETIDEYAFVAFVNDQQNPIISWEHDKWQ